MNQLQFRKKIKGAELVHFFRSIGETTARDTLVFVCIGTDRSTGDSLGPIVGTRLIELGWPHVIGTLDHPCDASNLPIRIEEVMPGQTVIAIDACLGRPESVGWFQVSNLPIKPGASVGKSFSPVGHYSIAGIVNTDGGRKYQILQNTSLFRVMQMAEQITAGIRSAFSWN